MPGYLSRDLLNEATADELRLTARRLANNARTQRQQAEQAAVAEPDPVAAPAAPAVDFGALTKSLTSYWTDEPTQQQQARQASGGGGFDLNGLIGSLTATWRDPEPVPTPSGAPAAMPGMQPQRQPVDATIQDGRTAPPSSGGQWDAMPVVQRGSHPEKQAQVYQEARAVGRSDEDARILVAVTETEGGLTGAIGDNGQSRGPFQFYEGGQMPGFRAWVGQQGIQGDPNELVHDVRLATRYAATTYLGRALDAGRAKGLSGADLATYVQQHGQVSVDPWKTGQNYQRLYGGGQSAPAPQQPAVAPVQQSAAPRPQYATASENPNSAQYARPGAQKFRVRDEWGNEYEMTQEQMDKIPGGGGHLTVIGPVAVNAGPEAAHSGPAPSPAPAAGAPPTGGGSLPPSVAQKWRQMYGREPSPEEAQELAVEMARFA